MVNFNISLLFFGLIFLNSWVITTQAYTLEEVRNIARSESYKKLSDVSQNRIQEIRKELKTSHLSLGNEDTFLKLPSNRERSESSSDYIKFFFRKIMQKFSEMVRYGSPQVVDPSVMWHEVQTKEDEFYTQLYEPIISRVYEELKTDVQQILLGYNAVVLENNSNNEAPLTCDKVPNQLSILGSPSDYSKWLKAKNIIEKYLQDNSNVADTLGSIWKLDVVKGRIQRIRFTKCAAANFGANINLSDLDQVMLNLSSLISIYTGLDEVFIQTQMQFLKVVDAEIEKMQSLRDKKTTKIVFFLLGGLSSEEEVRLKIFLDVKANLEAKISGAKYFNHVMNQVSKADQATLIDLMIQLNIDDIPSENDIKSIRDYHEEIFSKVQRDADFAKEYLSSINQIELALKFYQSLHNDLNILENDLSEKKAGRNFIDRFKKELRR